MIFGVKLFTPPPYPNVSRIAAGSLRASAKPAARDIVIDFGKFKGRMLGSLPSAYLKWVSSNLRAGDTEEWARLADRVLVDPVYRDRLEWEAAEKILSGNAVSYSSRGSAVSELLEISQSFGWDNEDKSGWSKVDFGLLGTSKSGRIPRAEARANLKEEEEVRRRNESSSVGGKRGERRERVRRRVREKETSASSGMGTSSPLAGPGGAPAGSPFPGREALLKKVLNRDNL